MKKVFLFVSVSFLVCSAQAQDIFKKNGFNKEPLTLSKGRYEEVFTNKEVVQIGSVLLNTKTNKVVKFLDEETDTATFSFKAEYSSHWLSPDPLAEKYPQLSPYVFCANNPIRFYDPTGKEPREGNKVLNVNFGNSFITFIGDKSGKIGSYDKHLARKALDEQAWNTSVGGVGMVVSTVADLIISIFGDEAGNNPYKQSGYAHTWLEAAKSSNGYEYVELAENNTVIRRVTNMNEKLGVEGFENVVTEKQTREINSENVLTQEHWAYRTVESSDGTKHVESQHITIDLRPGAKNVLTKDEWQVAQPSRYNPDEY
ncbi:MAG: hypothetical protein FWD66_03670 [Paludibacter sp.]|nr:hypothetical protein [Paludibacter sp.]